MRVHCTLVLHLHNKSDIPGKSVQYIWRMSTANKGSHCSSFRSRCYNGDRDKYSNTRKKTTEISKNAILSKNLLFLELFCKGDRGNHSVFTKNLVFNYPMPLRGGNIDPSLQQPKYINSDISVNYSVKVKNVDLFPSLH